jgi:general stress protein 26
MNKINPRKLLHTIMQNYKFAVIATQTNNKPYKNLVAFVSTKDMKNIIFSTSKNSTKYKNLHYNSQISLLIDTRGNDPLDIQNAVTITALRKAQESTEYVEPIKEMYLKKHPYLSTFVDSKDSVFIRVIIDTYIIVNHFQNINILNP